MVREQPSRVWGCVDNDLQLLIHNFIWNRVRLKSSHQAFNIVTFYGQVIPNNNVGARTYPDIFSENRQNQTSRRKTF